MKKFSIFRYLKQFSLLIFLLAVVGSVAIYRYGKSQQRYIASTVIRYANKAAQDGFTPDGSPLNVEEIFSSTVIDAALKDLGYQSNIDSIRSNCYVEEIVPETKQKLMSVLLDKGEETSYTADTYRVYFVGGSSTNAVIAGHRSWNGYKYFLDIELLELGDEVYITNLWGTLTYKVTEIKIINPNDIQAILIQRDRDMVTLLTCHPYGSGGKYRYLVFCERADEAAPTDVSAASVS